MTVNDRRRYVIESDDEKDDEGYSLYWSNTEGWVLYADATVFTDKEYRTSDLPMGGTWRKVIDTGGKDGASGTSSVTGSEGCLEPSSESAPSLADDPDFGTDSAVVPVVIVMRDLLAQHDSAATAVSDMIEAYLDADWNESKTVNECAILACRDLLEAASGALKRLEGR